MLSQPHALICWDKKARVLSELPSLAVDGFRRAKKTTMYLQMLFIHNVENIKAKVQQYALNNAERNNEWIKTAKDQKVGRRCKTSLQSQQQLRQAQDTSEKIKKIQDPDLPDELCEPVMNYRMYREEAA